MLNTVRTLAFLTAIVLGTACSNNSSQSTTTPTPASPQTQVFTSQLAQQGVNTESFVAAQAGTISVTLTSVTPAIVLGVGLGVPNPSAPGCSLATIVNSAASSTAQITAPADAGTYCVSISDIGFVPPPGASFSISIAHP
jgi:hypothetical protein